jgi:hypothetical protein
MNIKIRLNKWIINKIQKIIIKQINIIILVIIRLNKIKIFHKSIIIVLFKD